MNKLYNILLNFPEGPTEVFKEDSYRYGIIKRGTEVRLYVIDEDDKYDQDYIEMLPETDADDFISEELQLAILDHYLDIVLEER